MTVIVVHNPCTRYINTGRYELGMNVVRIPNWLESLRRILGAHGLGLFIPSLVYFRQYPRFKIGVGDYSVFESFEDIAARE